MNKIKFVTASLALALVATVLVSAPRAHAESPNILVGENLTIGSTGRGVVALQGLMTELGYLNVPAGVPFGYYGSLTKNAVSKYQASQYVTPTVGYYGPLTKVAMFTDFSNHGWVHLLGWDNPVNN